MEANSSDDASGPNDGSTAAAGVEGPGRDQTDSICEPLSRSSIDSEDDALGDEDLPNLANERIDQFGRPIMVAELLMDSGPLIKLSPASLLERLRSGSLSAFSRLPLEIGCHLSAPKAHWRTLSLDVFEDEYITKRGGEFVVALPQGLAIAKIFEAIHASSVSDYVGGPVDEWTVKIDIGELNILDENNLYDLDELKRLTLETVIRSSERLPEFKFSLELTGLWLMQKLRRPGEIKAKVGSPPDFEWEAIYADVLAALLCGYVSRTDPLKAILREALKVNAVRSTQWKVPSANTFEKKLRSIRQTGEKAKLSR